MERDIKAYGGGGAVSRGDEPHMPALVRTRERLKDIEHRLDELLGIADRVFGFPPPQGDARVSPAAVPNGLIEEINNDLDKLMGMAAHAVMRLRELG
jgi:hypothetical protein